MSEYIKKIRTTDGDKQIDYNALANLPVLLELDDALNENGKAADAKIVGENFVAMAQDNDNKYANVVKGYAGGELVRVNDVSPIEHTPKVKVSGKNLVPYPFLYTSKTFVGGTFTALADGGITGNGTPTDYCDMYLYEGEPLVKGGIITASLSGTYANMMVMLAIYNDLGNELVVKNCDNNSVSINLDEYPTAAKWLILIKRKTNNVAMSGTAYLQIEKGDLATEYSPYVDPSTSTLTYGDEKYTPDSKGFVKGLTSTYPIMEMSVPNGFNVFLEYNKDTNAVIKKLADAIVALGGTV